MMAPVCGKCHVEMNCEKNGVAVVSGEGLYHGDRYKCLDCGIEIVTGFGRQPIREGWEPDFGAVLANEACYGPVIDIREKQETE